MKNSSEDKLRRTGYIKRAHQFKEDAFCLDLDIKRMGAYQTCDKTHYNQKTIGFSSVLGHKVFYSVYLLDREQHCSASETSDASQESVDVAFFNRKAAKMESAIELSQEAPGPFVFYKRQKNKTGGEEHGKEKKEVQQERVS